MTKIGTFEAAYDYSWVDAVRFTQTDLPVPSGTARQTGPAVLLSQLIAEAGIEHGSKVRVTIESGRLTVERIGTEKE